jgi:hypothetical protein
LQGNPCPVVDFKDEQTWVRDSIKIFNNSHKKVYYTIELTPNPKFQIVFAPESSSIPRVGTLVALFTL